MSESPAEYDEIQEIETEPESEEARLEYKRKRCEIQKASKKKRFLEMGVKGFVVYCHADVIDNLRKYAKALTEAILEKQKNEAESPLPETESDER